MRRRAALRMPSRTARSSRPPVRTSGTRACARVYGGGALPRRISLGRPTALPVDELGVAEPRPRRDVVRPGRVERAGTGRRTGGERIAALHLDLAPPLAIAVVAP